MTAQFSRLLPTLAAALLLACDDRQAFHEPTPSLARMLSQPRPDPYGSSPVFADGRVMREPVPDTVPRERHWLGQPQIATGRDDAGYVQDIPVPVTRAQLQRGRVAFERVCANCHGVLGNGVSVVAEQMTLRKPPSLPKAHVAHPPSGKVFEVASQGYGLMPGYAALLSVDERWAVVAYLEALRLSRSARVASLPDQVRAELERAAP